VCSNSQVSRRLVACVQTAKFPRRLVACVQTAKFRVVWLSDGLNYIAKHVRALFTFITYIYFLLLLLFCAIRFDLIYPVHSIFVFRPLDRIRTGSYLSAVTIQSIPGLFFILLIGFAPEMTYQLVLKAQVTYFDIVCTVQLSSRWLTTGSGSNLTAGTNCLLSSFFWLVQG
jgi:hypothetical protein